MRFTQFFTANVLGALVYVPTVVGAGYAIGYGLGEYVERLQKFVGQVERVILAVALVSALALIGWRIVHAMRREKGPVI